MTNYLRVVTFASECGIDNMMTTVAALRISEGRFSSK